MNDYRSENARYKKLGFACYNHVLTYDVQPVVRLLSALKVFKKDNRPAYNQPGPKINSFSDLYPFSFSYYPYGDLFIIILPILSPWPIYVIVKVVFEVMIFPLRSNLHSNCRDFWTIFVLYTLCICVRGPMTLII